MVFNYSFQLFLQLFVTTLSLKFDRLALDVPSFLHFWEHIWSTSTRTKHWITTLLNNSVSSQESWFWLEYNSLSHIFSYWCIHRLSWQVTRLCSSQRTKTCFRSFLTASLHSLSTRGRWKAETMGHNYFFFKKHTFKGFLSNVFVKTMNIS